MSDSAFVKVGEENKLFTGLGCMEGEFHIKLPDDAVCVVCALRDQNLNKTWSEWKAGYHC